MKNQMFLINHGSYPFEILFCLGICHKNVCKRIEKLGYTLSSDQRDKLVMSGVGRTVILQNRLTIVRVKNLKNKAAFHGCLAHEVFHAVGFCFDNCGIKYNLESSEEAFAYQIDYLLTQIYRKIL